MGVLMSKKQQVEKVQKCSVVVSAFKEGLKEHPSLAHPSEQPGESEDTLAETEVALPPKEEEKEEVQKEDDDKPGASTSQHASAQQLEDSRINQEAWSRLRNGKGVEPEELDKANQLTPPAFIRPKRDINDDQPVDINLLQKEQPVNDEMCEICEVWTADDLFPCRVCTRVFHDGCLREMGYLSTDTLQEMRDTAHTATGWSCYYCKGHFHFYPFTHLQDNVNLLLTEEEMYSLMETFKECKIIPESCLVADELLQYKHFVSKRLFEKDLSDEQEEEVLAQFSALDPEKKGQIEWADFLYHESLGVLSKFRSENSLVWLLTAKERDKARSVFLSLDQDRDELIMGGEARRAQQSWFQKHSKESQSCNVSISHVGPISENSPSSSSSEKCREKDDNRQVTWQQFVKDSALFILAARPNSPALHLHPLL